MYLQVQTLPKPWTSSRFHFSSPITVPARSRLAWQPILGATYVNVLHDPHDDDGWDGTTEIFSHMATEIRAAPAKTPYLTLLYMPGPGSLKA